MPQKSIRINVVFAYNCLTCEVVIRYLRLDSCVTYLQCAGDSGVVGVDLYRVKVTRHPVNGVAAVRECKPMKSVPKLTKESMQIRVAILLAMAWG